MRSDFKFGLILGALFSAAFITVFLIVDKADSGQVADSGTEAISTEQASSMQPLRTQQQGFLPEGGGEFVRQATRRTEPIERQTQQPPQRQPEQETTPRQQPAQPQIRKYTVERGDTLSGISMRFYGTTLNWQKILDANRNTLVNPAGLKPGMELIIPD